MELVEILTKALSPCLMFATLTVKPGSTGLTLTTAVALTRPAVNVSVSPNMTLTVWLPAA